MVSAPFSIYNLLLLPQTSNHFVFSASIWTKSADKWATGFFELETEVIILQRNNLEMFECCSTFDLLTHIRIILVTDQTFHHIAIFAILFVTMPIHGRSTKFHNNRTELDVAGFDLSKISYSFL